MILLVLAALASHAHPRPIGKETSIAFAGSNGLRDWQAGPDRRVLYVRDVEGRWYQVHLNQPCVDSGGSLSIGYTTDTTGSFDKFSTVYSTEFPNQPCHVTSVTTSLAPPPKPTH